MSLFSDNPQKQIQDDKFGFKEYVQILGESIIDINDLPFTVGIFGEWGTGKTTLMYYLENWFKEKDIKTIWLNPWKYDRKEELWAAIIRELLLEIADKDDKLEKKIIELLKKMSCVAIQGGLSYMSGGLLAGSFETFRENIANAKRHEHEFLHKFDDEFKNLVKEFIGNNGKNKKIVIFIDDLDRCKPENAISVLESLKLYLDNEYCIFVLGVDRVIIEKGIQLLYGDRIEISGREYLDKIIQLSFYIPPIQYEKLNGYLSKSTLTDEYSEQIWSLINFGFGGNPRKAKRFVNSYHLLKKAMENRKLLEDVINPNNNSDLISFNDYSKDDKLFFLAKILIIQMVYPEYYDYLLYDNDGLNTFTLGKNLQQKQPDKFKKFLLENPDIEYVLNNRDLKRFMTLTEHFQTDFPENPPPHIMRYLLLLAGVVEGKIKEGKSSDKSAGTAESNLDMSNFSPSGSTTTSSDSSGTISTDFYNK